MSNRIYAFGGLGGLICGIDFGIKEKLLNKKGSQA